MYQFQLNQNGCIRFGGSARICIQDAPIGILVHNQTAYHPLSAVIDGSEADVQYPCGICRIKITESDGYVKLTLVSIPDGTDGFVSVLTKPMLHMQAKSSVQAGMRTAPLFVSSR